MPRTKLYFPNRIPEPKRLPAGEAGMGELELKVFEQESKKITGNFWLARVPFANEP